LHWNKQPYQPPAKTGKVKKQNSLQQIKNGKAKYSYAIMQRGEKSFELDFHHFPNKYGRKKREKIKQQSYQKYRG
jgi:hypothetical protein